MDECFDVPSRANEFGGQPIEQFRVRRQLALSSEFLARGDKSDAKYLFPKTVDRNPGGQGVFLIHQPLGQIHSGRFLDAFGGRKERDRKTCLDFVSKIQVGPAEMNVSGAALVFGQLSQDWNGGALDPGKFLLQVLELFGTLIPGRRSINRKIRSEESLVGFRKFLVRFRQLAFPLGVRCLLAQMGPNGLAIGVQGNRPELLEAIARASIRTIVEKNPIDRLFGTKINFQPRPIRLARMGDRLADEIVPIGIPIDGKFGRAVEVGAYLGGLALSSEVFVTLKDLDLSQMKPALFVRVDDPDKPCLQLALRKRQLGFRNRLCLLDLVFQFFDLLAKRHSPLFGRLVLDL